MTPELKALRQRFMEQIPALDVFDELAKKYEELAGSGRQEQIKLLQGQIATLSDQLGRARDRVINLEHDRTVYHAALDGIRKASTDPVSRAAAGRAIDGEQEEDRRG